MINNAIPNFASSNYVEVSKEDLDKVFEFQQTIKPPQQLTSTTLYILGIAQEEKSGGKILEKLKKLGIAHQGPPYVSTQNIGKNFANQMAIISSYAQKRLVSFLFDWEEEVRRWAVLEDEEKELHTVIEETKRVGGDVGHYEKRLMEIEGLKKLKPSLRVPKTTNQEQPPPAYQPSGAS
jgi:hypothetical protein